MPCLAQTVFSVLFFVLYIHMLWTVPWWSVPVLPIPSAPSWTTPVEHPCSCCCLALGAFHRDQARGASEVQPHLLEMRVAAGTRWSLPLQTLYILGPYLSQRRSFSFLLLTFTSAHLNTPHEHHFQQGIHSDLAHSQDTLSSASLPYCSWMCRSIQTHFLFQRTVQPVLIGQFHSPDVGRGHWQLGNSTGSHRMFPTSLHEEALLSLNMWYCHLPACIHHSLQEE